MNEAHASQTRSAAMPAGEETTRRAAYASPVLHVYGSIRQLTMGFGGSSVDTIMNSNRMIMGGG